MQKPGSKGEVMRNAQRLVKTKGDKALVYAEKMAKRMQDTGEEEDQVFWNRIASQVDLLLYETDG